jgi:hypothetical protein
MSSLADLIKEINTQISTVAESFVYYDKETGKIQKISNKKIDSDLEVFKIETDLVKDIIVGKKRTDDFLVTYDLSEKRLTVKEITYESELNSIKYKLYEIPEIKNSYHQELISNFSQIYEGIHVDVWYNKLEHLSGQHVWFDNNVYMIKNDQSAHSNFNFENVEIILENVKLFNDDNKNLKFSKHLNNGDKFLNYNKLYLYQKIDIEYNEYDLIIRQDILDKCWKIFLSSKTKKELIESNYNLEDRIYFSITQKHNPNILYKTLDVNLKDLLYNSINYPFKYDWEVQSKEVSIYTPKFFDSYIYEVIH